MFSFPRLSSFLSTFFMQESGAKKPPLRTVVLCFNPLATLKTRTPPSSATDSVVKQARFFTLRSW